MSHAHAGNVSDGIEGSRLQATDADAEFARAHSESLRCNPALPERVYGSVKARSRATILGVLLAGCGIGSGPSATMDPNLTDAAPATPPPVRIGPDGPEPPDTTGLQAYGAEHADQFGGMYIDPPGGSSVVMLFTADPERHQAAVNAILPGTRVRQVEHTEAELVALLESFDFQALQAQGIEMIGGSVDVIGNRVELEVKSNDPTVELRMEIAHGGLVDVTVYPLPGAWANVTEGEGWRLLTAGETGNQEAFTVRVAKDADAWEEVWTTIGLEGPPPTVDFAEEVAVSFGHGIGSSCRELRLDGVAIQDGVVFSETSDPLSPRGCTADLAAAAMFVVAIERASLPDDGFTLRLSRTTVTCGADCGFTEEIEVPLP